MLGSREPKRRSGADDLLHLACCTPPEETGCAMTPDDTTRVRVLAADVALPRLLAIHRALMEAKFHPSPENRDVAGSPYVADLAHEVLDAIIAAEHEAGNATRAEQWRAWRRAAATKWVLERVRSLAVEDPQWSRLTHDERVDLVRRMASPFVADEADILAIVDRVMRAPRPSAPDGA